MTTEAQRAFSTRLVAGLVVVSAFSLLAVFALSAYAPELRSTDNPEANAFSKSAIGFAGIVRLLQECGIPVKIDRGQSAHERISQASLTILAPSLVNSAGQLREVGIPGARLFILPKWTAISDPLRSGWVMKISTLDARLITENVLDKITTKSALSRRADNARITLKAPLPSFDPHMPSKLGKVDSLQTISGPGLATLIRDAKGDAVLAQIAGTQTYILADPDLMNTQGIHDLSTAWTAVALIRQMRVGKGPVVFDVTLNGFESSPNLFALAFRPPFLGATICGLLTAVLIGLHAASRFGTPAAPLPAFALGKQALAGNTADLIRIMGREPAMARRYAQTTRSIVLKTLGVPRDLSNQQAQILFKRLERNLSGEDRFAALAAESAQPSTRAHMLRVAQRLYQWRKWITHEH
jgi:hypothetical protein